MAGACAAGAAPRAWHASAHSQRILRAAAAAPAAPAGAARHPGATRGLRCVSATAVGCSDGAATTPAAATRHGVANARRIKSAHRLCGAPYRQRRGRCAARAALWLPTLFKVCNRGATGRRKSFGMGFAAGVGCLLSRMYCRSHRASLRRVWMGRGSCRRLRPARQHGLPPYSRL